MARYGDLGTQYFDDAGDPLVSGRIYFYETGTTTPKTTYADVDFTIPNTNPVILTAAGRQPNIFFDGVAKAILTTSTGTQILVRDPVGDTANSFGNPWIASKRYTSNDVVQGSDGQYYVSLINGNVNNNPVTTTGNWTFLYSVEWSAGTTYKEGSVITYDNLLYQSLQDSNLNKNPLTEPTYWVLISLAYVSTTTYTVGQNVVGPDGVFYTALRTTIGDTPASSPSDWVGTSAAAAASATAALASQVAAAASAATATTQASNASASAATATTQATAASASASSASTSATNASNSASAASSSASAASTSASNASTSASSALTSANNATTQANAASASAAAAAAIVDISSVTTFTNPLARAVQVAITAATSASNGIQQLTNTQNNFGTGNFALQWRGSVPDWTPAANVILLNKHDGTNGYILTLLTTGFLRLTINATNFDSTVVTGMTDNYVAMIDVDITAATTTAAGSVVFTLNGVQLGTTLVISARVEEIVNGNFDTDITGWTLATGSGGTATWSAGSLRITRSGDTAAYQAISLAAGETLFVSCVATYVSGASSTGSLLIRSGPEVNSTALATATTSASSSGTLRVSYYSSAAATVYVHLRGNVASAVYDFDTVTSLDSATVDNTSSLYVCGTSAVRSASQWFSHRLFNRAKTVAENLGMFVNGASSFDQKATQTPIYTSDFSATADSFTGTSITVTGNVDGIAGVDNVLKGECSATGTGRRLNRSGFTILNGFKYELKIDAYFEVANSNCDSIMFADASANRLFAGDHISNQTKGVWVSHTFVFDYVGADISGSLRFYTGQQDSSSASMTLGDILYIKNLSIRKIGITSELIASNAQTDNGQVLDSSGNKQHAKLAEAGMSTQGAISARRREVRWTNTWAGTNELQYIGGVNQAILPSNAYIESIVGTVSGATPHDIIVGDGSDTDRYVTITTGLAAGTTSFTVAARTTDGTNLKLTVDPDTDATMSIAWVITYYRLES
jgi:hypothetical protein